MKNDDWFFDKFDHDFDKTVKRTFGAALVISVLYMLFWAAVIIGGLVLAYHIWW